MKHFYFRNDGTTASAVIMALTWGLGWLLHSFMT